MIAECLTYYLMIFSGVLLELFIFKKIIGYEIKIQKVLTIIVTVIVLVLPIVTIILKNELVVEILTLLPSIAMLLAPGCFVNSESKARLLLTGLLLDFIFQFFATIFTVLIFKNEDQLPYNIAYTGFALLFFIVFLLLFWKKQIVLSKKFFESLPIFFYIVMVVAIFSLKMFNNLSEINFDSIRTDVATVVTLVGVCYLLTKYATSASREREAEALIEMQAEHYEELAQKNQDIRRFRHDIKNNMFALSILINDNKIDEAKNYISNLSNTIKETENRFNTGNYLADALISQKADEARAENITIAFEGAIPAEGMSNNDICTIFGNSLDNAIRACTEIAPCTIRINSAVKDNGYTVTIFNPVKQKVEIKNNTIKTSKKDKENHGLGLGNIKRVAEKHKGYVKLNCTDTEFSIKIGLMLE